MFNPLMITRNTIPPGVVIQDVKVFGESHAFDPLGKIPVKLNYDQNYLTFDFTALDFHAPIKNNYTYPSDLTVSSRIANIHVGHVRRGMNPPGSKRKPSEDG